MATQAGITVAGVNEPYKAVENITRPRPSPKQVLLKSLVTGINPVEPFMHHSGMLVTEWPAVLGCDASGVVIECGSEVKKFKKGDYAYGCTRVGQNQYSTFQETFLMDEEVAFKRGSALTTETASTIGVGLDTAALALIAGTGLKIPEPGNNAEEKDEWIIIIGASGTVGQFGVQLGKLCGYKVLASCSSSKASIPKSHGADATLDHRSTVDEQLAEIKKITGGNFARVFDASTYGYDLAIKALETCSTTTEKWFTTVDDWSEMNTPKPIHEYRTLLGTLGRYDDPKGATTTSGLASWIPSFEGHIEKGTLKPLEYEVVEGTGWEAVIKGIAQLESGKASKKLVVKIQDE